MPAANKKCHDKGCICATCDNICTHCLIAGRCPDEICKSEHGMQNCTMYEENKDKDAYI